MILAKNEGLVDGADVDDVMLRIIRNEHTKKSLPQEIRIPEGLWTFNKSHLYITGEDTPYYETINLSGEGYSKAYGGSGTILYFPNAKKTPCTIMNSARDAKLSNLCIRGPNRRLYYGTPITNEPTTNPGDYVNAGLSMDRYGPQCGLGIDATLGNRPEIGGYDELAYTNRLNATSRVTLTNVTFEDHVIPLMVSPNLTQQADGIALYFCTLGESLYLISTGQPQARGMMLIGCTLGGAMIGMVGNIHGLQQGVPPIVYAGQAGYLNELFAFSASFGMLQIHGMRAESIKSLGCWGIGASGSVLPAFIQMEAQMENDNWSLGGYLLKAFAPVSLQVAITRPGASEARNKFRLYGEERYFNINPSSRIGDWRSKLVIGEGNPREIYWDNVGNWDPRPVGRM